MLALVELNFDDLVGKDCAYGGCVHAVAEASMDLNFLPPVKGL